MWRYKLRDGFNCLVRLTEGELSSYIIYLQEPDNRIVNFMDYMKDPFIFKKGGKSDAEFAISICEEQLDYYEKLKIFPDEEYIRSILYPFTDEDLYLNNDEIKYGYEYKIKSESEYGLVQYHKVMFSNFICAFILNSSSSDRMEIKEIEEIISEFRSNLKMDYGDDFKVRYLYDERGLVVIIELKRY